MIGPGETGLHLDLEIQVIGAPVLRRCAEAIGGVDARLRDLVERMFRTMYGAEGQGLAAPQIGRSIRLALMDVPPEGPPYVLINPRIAWASGARARGVAGCLNIPAPRWRSSTSSWQGTWPTSSLTGAAAVCGPVGDCNTVQQSDYARLAGVVPVGVLGVIGYGGFLIGWAATAVGPGSYRRTPQVLLWCMAILATALSLYLTVLEPFVIGATCASCLSSALVTALILLSTAGALDRSAEERTTRGGAHE